MNSNNSLAKHNRLWCDGCYDIVHFGHANSLRQAKILCNKLIVGVHSDSEVSKHKRKPIYTEKERYKLIKGIKWVDEVVEDAPYVTKLEILEKYDCDYCAHGNDITTTLDGIDSYQIIKESNRYEQVERTPGISTTGIINRILKTTKYCDLLNNIEHSKWTGNTNDPFLMTTSKIFQFLNNNCRKPKNNEKIVYAPGSYDLFHIGHLDFLEHCKMEGDYLIVGLYTDETIKILKDDYQYPIMNLQERVFNVLSYKCVDEVIIGSPYVITEDIINQLKIDIVCHGFRNNYCNRKNNVDPFKECKNLGKFKSIDLHNKLRTENIIERIVGNGNLYAEQIKNKEEKEFRMQ